MVTSRRVLLIEDDRVVRELFQTFLRSAGFAVASAGDGLTALRMIDNETPDVIVLDLDIPLVSGLDVYRTLRSRPETEKLPVIIASGSVEHGPDDAFRVLRKPITRDQIVEAVTRACESPGKTSFDPRR